MKPLPPAQSTPDSPTSSEVNARPSPVQITAPLPNYTLSTVCPNCDAPTYRRACKVRCDRCGFMWDCSEL